MHTIVSSQRFISLLACPTCRSRLTLEGESFRCATCSAAWPVVEGIPTFLRAPARNGLFYDSTYWNTLARYGGMEQDKFYLSVVDNWLDILDVRPSATYLDVSCGEGHSLYMAAERGAIAVGIDISFVALRAASKKFSLTGMMLAEARSLPFSSGVFERVSCLGSLEHYDNPSQALQEIQRVSTSSALFLFVVPNSRHIFRHLMSLLDPQKILTAFDLEGWRKFLWENGFVVLQDGVDNHYYFRPIRPFRLGRLFRRALAPVSKAAGKQRAWQFYFLCKRKS